MSNNVYNFLNKQKDISSSSLLLLSLLSILFIITLTPSLSLAKNTHLSLKDLDMEGHFEFEKVNHAAVDFGNRFHHLPAAILYPKTVADVALAVRHVWEAGPGSGLKIAARGHGHSLAGQSQARGGIVVNMESLKLSGRIRVSEDYVDVSGGELWVNVLRETLRHGLAPRSWTDYLHLTVGGTLSNAGVSGQTFRHGPQISNVRLLEVVTGKGEIVNCSREKNADLFHGVLGGLGQFGIITKARISLEPAPSMVRWIRVLYTDFAAFIRDQERLISSKKTFEYVEGFVIINRTGLLNNWRSSFDPRDPVRASQFDSDDKTLYCLELAKHFNPGKYVGINQEIEELLGGLNYIPSTLFTSDVTYFEFLDRVHVSELKLREKGLWDVPHPWLNLLIPSTKIYTFAKEVFGKILTNTANGPVLIYPVNKSKWDNRTSAVIPEAKIFYLVAFLASAVPSSNATDGLDNILKQNAKILEFCETAHLGVKQYLAHFTTQKDWRAHFGAPRWEIFSRRKSVYDPLAMFSPGHRIFQTTNTYSSL